MGKVLLVSLEFPPSSVASVHRARHLAKYLPRFGWHPVVLMVDERLQKEAVDYPLAELVPEDLEILRIGALPLSPLRRLGIGDISLRAYFHLRASLARLLAERHFDVVFMTGPPYYQMMLTGWIKRRFHLPVVLDFQDPWVSHVGGLEPIWSKAGVTHGLAVLLEPRAVRSAAFITSVSDRQNEEMAARYPWLDGTRMAGIPIGGDPDDFRQLARAEGSQVSREVTVSFVGTVTPRALKVHEVVLQGLGQLRAEQPEVGSRLRLRFVGTSNQPDGKLHSIRDLALGLGLADVVREEPARVPFLEALRLMANSDALLLIGSDEPHYTASKIYPALMAGRPFLSVFHALSSAHAILAHAGGGIALSFKDPASLATLHKQIARAFAELVTKHGDLGVVDPKAYAPFTAAAVSERYAKIFDRVKAEGQV
ncbi:MAG: glycosyltransferase [Rhizomicrobium sp.]